MLLNINALDQLTLSYFDGKITRQKNGTVIGPLH